MQELGIACDYHFHNFDHTVLPFSGLWKVTAYTYEEGDKEPNPDNFIAERLIAPAMYAPQGQEVAPWILIQKNRWHRIELVSKTLYAGGKEIEVDECEFWCCFSIRDTDGEVVEYLTGWEPAFN